MPGTIDDTVRFEDGGATFELFGPATDGTRQVAVTDAAGNLDALFADDFPGICRAVDAWIAVHVPRDAPGRFNGLRYLLWSHETRMPEERSIPTRGAFLERFDSGTSPADLDAVVSLLQCSGDRVLEIRDNDGRLILDSRREVRRELEALDREEFDQRHAALDVPMRGIGR